MSAGPTSEGTLRFVKTYEVGMNTDSPNGPGPERLICRPGLPPAGRATSLVAGAPPVRPRAAPVVFEFVRPDCTAYYRQLGGCPWPPGTTLWGRRIRRRAGPLGTP